MMLTTALLGIGSGILIGLVLGLIGGGGSILAVPLLISVVGVDSVHAAIGTAAIAVALNAAFGLVAHWRAGTVNWHCASIFAAAGVFGAIAGSELGKAMPGKPLLGLFGALMIVVGVMMLRPRHDAGTVHIRLCAENARRILPKLIGIGLGVGLLSGFFGIGGGFLIVPGLIAATGMTMRHAIGSSLVGVTAFGATTATSYALSGLVLWPIVWLLIAGGIIGAVAGTRLSGILGRRKGVLDRILAGAILIIGVQLVWQWAFGQ